MAESQDQSVSVSTKCDEALIDHQESEGELTLQSLSGAKDQVDTQILELIAEHLKELQGAIAARTQVSLKTAYNEKEEKKIHETLTAAARIVSELLSLIVMPQSLSPERLIDPLIGLVSTIETPGIDVDHVNTRSSVKWNSWRPGPAVDWGIKAILKNIASLAALIHMNAEYEKKKLQDLQRLTEEKRQALSELEMKNQELSRLEGQLSFSQGLQPSSPSISNVDQPLPNGPDWKRKVAPEIRSILKTLYHSSRPYKDLVDSYSKRHKQFRANRLDATCTWFVRTQSFGSWLASGSPRLLWCYGALGIGKSTITSLIIDGLLSKSNGQNFAFYYMGSGKVQSAAGLMLSLLEQLCADGAEVPPSLKRFYARGPHHPKFGLDDALPGAPTPRLISAEKSTVEEMIMEQPAGDEGAMGKSSTRKHQGGKGSALDHYPTLEVLFNALKDVSQETTADTIIIVDGWDECNMDSEDEFRRLLGVLTTLPWKICVTSRGPPTDLDSAYCSVVHIRETDNAEDIRAFTEHTLLQEYQGFRRHAAQNILGLSQGIYLFAKLSVKMMLGGPNLEIMPGKIASSYLSQIYSPEPASTIKRALEAIGNEPDCAGVLSKTVIIWVAKLKQPLSLAALLESLSMVGDNQPVEVDGSVIDRCGGLVMIDEGNSCVHLAPYKIDEVAKEIWPKSYHNTVCMLASTCLDYLMLEEFAGGCRETEEELIRLLAAHPFLDYAARCWAYHRRDICELQSSQANGEPERDNNFNVARFPEIWAGNGSQEGQPDPEVLSSNNVDDDAGEKDLQDDDTGRMRLQNPSVTSGPGIQDITETLLEKPNFLLALQILLYRDKAAAPFANQWAVHKEKINCMSKLHKAARFGLTALVDKLATNSSDLCEKDSEGSTALHEAAKEGFEDVIERLLKDDSSSALVMNDYKKTPMHLAKARGHHKAFSIIFEKACAAIRHHKAFSIIFEKACAGIRSRYDPVVEDENGDKFITYYSIHNSGISNDPKRIKEVALTNAINLRKEDVIFILLRDGVDANCRDEADVPAVHLAIQTGSLPMLQLLLDKGADPGVKARNNAGESSLHLAARLGMTDVVELLLLEGADLLDVDEQGRTVLFLALEASDLQAGYDVITILLEQDVDVNKKDHTGRNILHVAAQKGNSRALLSLIYRVEDYSHKDANWKTPLDYAREGGHKDAEEVLREWIDRRLT